METTSLNLIVTDYIKVIKAFKKRSDVQNGWALAYRPGQNPKNTPEFGNIPKSIGDGLSTSGWCVSASQALLIDNVFQILVNSRGARAKLVSIDIREQWYGETYNGYQNKWHTAILINDSNINFIIDLTCSQFGNRFVGKEIWDFKTWESTFRSPVCEHKLLDFEGTNITTIPTTSAILNKDKLKVVIENRLHDIITITNGERKLLSEFFIDKFDILNEKLLLGNINALDFKYLEEINRVLRELDFSKYTMQYCILKFVNVDSAKAWLAKLMKNDFILQQYIITSSSIDDCCKFNNYEKEMVNVETDEPETYILFYFENIQGIDVDFIQYGGLCIPTGIKLNINPKTDIKNGGVLLSNDLPNLERKTNTIYINVTL